jgi:uncharacterized membrane protein
MQDLKIPTLIIFWASFVLLTTGILVAHKLFKLLKKRYASYYQSIGKPLTIAYGNATFEEYVQLMKGSLFMYSVVFKGIPQNFPKDKDLRKLAQAIRISMTIMLILVITLVVMGYFLYKSWYGF